MLVITGGRRRGAGGTAGIGDLKSTLKGALSTVGGAIKQEAQSAGRATLTSVEQSVTDKLRNLISGKPGAGGKGATPASSNLPLILGGVAAAGLVGYLVLRR